MSGGENRMPAPDDQLNRIRRDWPIHERLPVFSSDGLRVGEIRQVCDDCFRVGSLLRRGCWLSRAHVVFADDDHALLLYQAHQVSEHRVKSPHRRWWLAGFPTMKSPNGSSSVPRQPRRT